MIDQSYPRTKAKIHYVNIGRTGFSFLVVSWLLVVAREMFDNGSSDVMSWSAIREFRTNLDVYTVDNTFELTIGNSKPGDYNGDL